MEAWRQRPLGGRRKPCSMKLAKNRLDSDRPSHGRRLHQSLRLGLEQKVGLGGLLVKSRFLANYTCLPRSAQFGSARAFSCRWCQPSDHHERRPLCVLSIRVCRHRGKAAGRIPQHAYCVLAASPYQEEERPRLDAPRTRCSSARSKVSRPQEAHLPKTK